MAKEGSGCFTKIFAAGLCVIAVGMCSRALRGDKDKTAQSVAASIADTSSPAASLAAASAAPVVLEKLPASTLLRAYQANEIAADARYKGKRFQITGSVVAVKSDITNDPQVWLVSELNPVVATGLGKSFAASLNKGDNMFSNCTVDGSVVGMPQIDCSGPQ